MLKVASISTTYREGYPSVFDLYQAGMTGGDGTPGILWTATLKQLQVFTNTPALNEIDLIAEDESGTEFPILSKVRISKSTSPVDLMPLLGYSDGLMLSADLVLKVKIGLPQNITGNAFITFLGFAEESGIVPEA